MRNQVEWKSENYRIKETTSIQTGRRDRDTEQAGPTSTCGGLKFRRNILGAKSLTPIPDSQPRVPMPGS